MDYNILNLIKPGINISKTETVLGEKSPAISLVIKFNIPLNPHLLDDDSAFIANAQGIVLPSSVKYDKAQNAINLSIKNEWQEGSYYFLNIGGNIKSLSGHSLSGKVKYRFKIKDGKPSDFLLVSGKTSLGANRINPNITKANVQIIEKLPIKKKKANSKISKNLPYEINFYLIGMLSAAIVFFTFLLTIGDKTFLYLGVAALLFLGVYLFAYFCGKKGKSQLHYNLGAFSFNSKQYEKSVYHFEKALYFDKKNVKSKLALDLAFSQYLNKM